ncbi:coadhesin-like isoform X2 [Ruditapes philippinarum]|nr:coadhesin-like isoform X2 [Ruditapes philippinarum]
MKFKCFLSLMSFHIANISSVFITFDKFELSYSFTFDKMSYLTEHRLQFISGISVTHCVKECAARTHCKALRFRNRINVCELFASSLQDLTLTTGSITLQEGEQNITKSPCQDNCKYGEVCETNESDVSTCVVKECVNITIPENGFILGNKRDIGKRIRYKCNVGYVESNAEIGTVAECLYTGDWSTFTECIPSKISYMWTTWTEWSTCSVSCGGGVKSRSRTCTIPTVALNGEEECEENMYTGAGASCNKEACT